MGPKMLSFKTFLFETPISSSGQSAERHIKKYIDPHIGSKTPTHTTTKDFGSIKGGSKVRIHKKVQQYHRTLVHVSDEQGNKETMPVSRLHKPNEGKVKNKGLEFEQKFVEHLKKHGLMHSEAKGAGSTAGNDFHIINRKTGEKLKVRVHEGVHDNSVNEEVLDEDSIHFGETKLDTSAAFGQLTIHHHPKKGWHIPEESRKKRPKYAAAIEKSGVLDAFNKHHKSAPKPEEGKKAKSFTQKHSDLKPIHAYLADHHVDVVHVGSHGTYRAGEHDKTGHGLPKMEGHGKWLVRQKTDNPNHRTVQFSPDGKKGLKPSHVDIMREDHMEAFKKSLGHS